MNIHFISNGDEIPASGELGYMYLKVPSVGTMVTLTEKPDKYYEIMKITISADESDITGLATILAVNENGDDLGEEPEIVGIAHLSVV